MDRKLRYQKYLDKYEDCPSSDCSEREIECFRWVHKEYIENDFIPQPLMERNPPRVLDDKDTKCNSFCLSLYKDLESSKENYNSTYSRLLIKKENLAEVFRRNVGDHSAKIILLKEDGISDIPNNKTGHFSFHPYEDTKLLDKVIGIFNNFD